MIKRLAIIIVSGGFFLSASIPAFAVTSISINGNGPNSTNVIHVTSSNASTIQQSNGLNLSTNVNSQPSSGNNSASGDNGNVTIKTGNVSSNVTLINHLNSNVATILPCWCTGTCKK